MSPNYTYSESTVKPLAIEIFSKTVFLRKDIAREERTETDSTKSEFWVYQEAKLSIDEFNAYSARMAAINAINGVNDSENIGQIAEGQKSSNDNQFVIMEAIADLYDALATLMV
ncbi:MAG: hypothetical protein Q4C65_02370 [Eubacteriales bacterium]|nr:hypothetical protein [Eubacteriales bacterium]